MNSVAALAHELSDIVMTSYYLSEPPRTQQEHLHDAEAKCLKIIHDFQPIRLNQLADLMHVTKPRATALVHVLTNKGLIGRVQGEDHRVVLVNTTKIGTDTVLQLRQKYIRISEEIILGMSSDKASLLTQLLREVNGALQVGRLSTSKEENYAKHV